MMKGKNLEPRLGDVGFQKRKTFLEEKKRRKTARVARRGQEEL